MLKIANKHTNKIGCLVYFFSSRQPRLPLYDHPCFETVLSKCFLNSDSVSPDSIEFTTSLYMSFKSSVLVASAIVNALA